MNTDEMPDFRLQSVIHDNLNGVFWVDGIRYIPRQRSVMITRPLMELIDDDAEPEWEWKSTAARWYAGDDLY